MKHYTILLAAFLLVFNACSKDPQDQDNTEKYAEILSNIGNNVIVETYEDLANKGSLLAIALQNLENDQTTVNLEAARNAWVAARSPWEQSEGFLFGPVDQAGIDPSIDSWPVNVTDLNNVLSNPSSITVSFLEQQEGTLKGFHTLEFLLWGENGNKVIGDFTTREFEYLAAAAEALSNDLNNLNDLWSPAEGNYINELITAGNGSAIYISQKSAIEELANAIVVIADEVGNGKINEPLAQQDVTLEESRFSANSKQDFADNIRSIKNIYIGSYSSFGNNQGLSKLIEENNPSLHTQIITEIDAAIDAIENIPGTFTFAVINNQTAVQTAQTAVRDLQETLETQLVPYISNL